MVNSTDPAMTDAANPVPLVERIDTTGEYLITKGGTYYRPNAEGYTRNRDEAGRYTLEEAIRHSHPNGPYGPRDGIRYELAPPTAALSAIPVPVEMQDLCERLDAITGTNAIVIRTIREAATALAQQAATITAHEVCIAEAREEVIRVSDIGTAKAQQLFDTIAALTAERDGLAAIVKEMKL